MLQYKLNIKKYVCMVKAGVVQSLFFRSSYFILLFSNIIYMIVIFSLWKAIYASSPNAIINGMSFSDTLIYLVLASALSNAMQTNFIWGFGESIRTGKIALELVRPMNYQAYTFWSNAGRMVLGFFSTFLPTFVLVCILTKGEIKIGFNLLFFLVSFLMAVIINYCFDFMAGILCIYTESIWGVNIMKEVVVLLLSGATIPIVFFPEPLQTIMKYLPFQAIYNAPLQVILSDVVSVQMLKNILLQLIWTIIMFILSSLMWKRLITTITINGG